MTIKKPYILRQFVKGLLDKTKVYPKTIGKAVELENGDNLEGFFDELQKDGGKYDVNRAKNLKAYNSTGNNVGISWDDDGNQTLKFKIDDGKSVMNAYVDRCAKWMDFKTFSTNIIVHPGGQNFVKVNLPPDYTPGEHTSFVNSFACNGDGNTLDFYVTGTKYVAGSHITVYFDKKIEIPVRIFVTFIYK